MKYIFHAFINLNFSYEFSVYDLSQLALSLVSSLYKNYRVEERWKRMKPRDTLIWSHISEGGSRAGEKWWNEEGSWKLVLYEGWLSSLFLGCSWPLWVPSAGCPDKTLCSPSLVLHWSSACLCVPRLLFLISAPWKVRMTESHTQGWRGRHCGQ